MVEFLGSSLSNKLLRMSIQHLLKVLAGFQDI
jgi:hypothetical protein